jgi:hypothetical protein
LLVDCASATILLRVETDHHPVEEAHDEVIVVAALAIGEHHSALLEQVILKGLSVVDGLDALVDGLVDVGRLSHGVLLLHVWHDLLLDVVINEADLPLS